jgi:general stress protein 26
MRIGCRWRTSERNQWAGHDVSIASIRRRRVPSQSSKKSEAHLYEIINDLDICILTTVESNGQLHSRPMGTIDNRDDGAIWFFTDTDGSIPKNLKSNPQVSLGYSNASGRHATISGKGEIILDRDLIEAKWTEDLKAWFPKGVTDPKIALLKVSPERGEYWDAGSSTLISMLGYLKAKVTGQKADDLAENKKVRL